MTEKITQRKIRTRKTDRTLPIRDSDLNLVHRNSNNSFTLFDFCNLYFNIGHTGQGKRLEEERTFDSIQLIYQPEI